MSYRGGVHRSRRGIAPSAATRTWSHLERGRPSNCEDSDVEAPGSWIGEDCNPSHNSRDEGPDWVPTVYILLPVLPDGTIDPGHDSTRVPPATEFRNKAILHTYNRNGYFITNSDYFK